MIINKLIFALDYYLNVKQKATLIQFLSISNSIDNSMYENESLKKHSNFILIILFFGMMNPTTISVMLEAKYFYNLSQKM